MYKVRPAVAADVPGIRLLEKELIKHERLYDKKIKEGDELHYYDIEGLINRSDNSVIMVVEKDNELVGCGLGEIRKNEHFYNNAWFGYIGMMSLKKEHRGTGLGGEIIKALLEWFKSKGITEAKLKVIPGNTGALRAYEKLGFETFISEMRLEI